MLQAVGLTSAARKDGRSAVDDVSFEALPGQVTAVLGGPGAGKTSLVRLVAGLDRGRGLTYFRGTPLHRLAEPAREIGLLLGDVQGHPARTVRGHLRMLAAAVGVPASRADELIDAFGLGGLRDEQLGVLSRSMDRRLGLAAALLGEPQTLLLDEPCRGLPAADAGWVLGRLRAHAEAGGTVLCTTRGAKEAARFADHVVTVDRGRLVADQSAADFARTRLRPRVVVRTPHAARLSDAVRREARAARRSVEVVTEGGSLLSVYGSNCAEIGEAAFRHGVLVHRLADEVGDAPLPAGGPGESEGLRESGTDAAVAGRAPGNPAVADAHALVPPVASPPVPGSAASRSPGRLERTAAARDPLPALDHRPRSPRWPLRYELRRMFGVRTAVVIAAATLVSSVALCLFLARTAASSQTGVLIAWPDFLPLPPAAFAAGLLGALSAGEEFRRPALAAVRGASPWRARLLIAKLAVTCAASLVLAVLSVAVDAQALRLLHGTGSGLVPDNWIPMSLSWAALCVGCAWAGLLAAAVFRVTAAGVAAVLSVPVLIAPLVEYALRGPAVRSVTGLPDRLRALTGLELPGEAGRWPEVALQLLAQPVGAALALSLTVLVCACLITMMRRRALW